MYAKWDKYVCEVSDSDSEEDVVRMRREEHEAYRKGLAQVPKEDRERVGCGKKSALYDATCPITLDDYYWEDFKERVIVHVRLPNCLQTENVALDIQFRTQSFNADVFCDEKLYRFAVTETPMEFIAEKSRGHLVNNELVIELQKFGKVLWERLQC